MHKLVHILACALMHELVHLCAHTHTHTPVKSMLNRTHSCGRFKENLYSFSQESMCVKSVMYGPSEWTRSEIFIHVFSHTAYMYMKNFAEEFVFDEFEITAIWALKKLTNINQI